MRNMVKLGAAVLAALVFTGTVTGAEMERVIVIYGDSNTYGYDPADMYEGRYPEELRWTSILQKQTEGRWRIVPEGLNGRKIPDLMPGSTDWLELLVQEVKASPEGDADSADNTGAGAAADNGQGGVFAVMLGTNDILSMPDPDAEVPEERMDAFLSFLTERLSPEQILVIAPVPSGTEDTQDPVVLRYYEESLRMNEKFRDLAEKYGVHFADAGEWGVTLCYDLVHISEQGQITFAENMVRVLEGLES